MKNSQPASVFSVDFKKPRNAQPLRRLAATLTGLGAATTLVFMLCSNNDAPWPIFVPVAFMVLAAFAFHAQSFALQVFARPFSYWVAIDLRKAVKMFPLPLKEPSCSRFCLPLQTFKASCFGVPFFSKKESIFLNRSPCSSLVFQCVSRSSES